MVIIGRGGQFYLVSAVIIIGLLIGFTTLANYSKRETYADIQNLQEEIGIEGNAVLEQIAYNPSIDELARFKEFTDTYANNEEKQNLYFIFGNTEKINVIKYQEVEPEAVSVNRNPLNVLDGTPKEFFSPGNSVTITIGSDNPDIYEFDLTTSNEIHFIISQNIGGEKHVVAD